MSDTIKIFGQLESGVVGGYVTNAAQIEGLEAALQAATAAIKTAKSSEYDSATHKIIFKDQDNAKMFELDATPFVKDGMLEKVEIKNGKLAFSFNTDSGQQALEIPITDIFNPNNYYSKTQVDQIAADIKTTGAITIAGGPLANNVVDSVDVWPSGWVDADGNKIIPAGKSLQEILTSLFLKEEPGTVSWSSISWAPKMNNPSVDVKVSGSSVKNKTVEVGTEVTIDASTTAGLQANTNVRKATLTVDPVTNGYFEGNTWKNVAKTVSQNGNNPTGTLTVSNSLKIGSANGTITNNKFTAGPGTNTVTTTQTGYTVTCSKLADTTIYASTNTRKKITTNPAVLTDAYPNGASVHTTTPPNTSATASVTGARYMFWGADDGKATLNSAYIRANKKGSAATAAATKIVDAQGALRIWIALPSGRSLNNLYNSLGSDLGSVMGDVDSSKTTNIEGANGFTAASYTLYVFESDSALNGDYTIVIK